MKPKRNNIALMSVISVVTICLLAMPAMAYYSNDGWHVTTRASGIINGSVFIDSENNFQKSTTLNSNVPGGTVKYDRSNRFEIHGNLPVCLQAWYCGELNASINNPKEVDRQTIRTESKKRVSEGSAMTANTRRSTNNEYISKEVE